MLDETWGRIEEARSPSQRKLKVARSMFSARSSALLIAAISSFSTLACGGGAPKQPPGAPPSPESVTKEEPGGDAFDPHLAALERQATASWGWRTDKDEQARFPLPDRRKWRRVRFFLVDHFVGFTYGKKDPHAVTAGFLVTLADGAPATSAACVEKFERDSAAQIAELGGKVTEISTSMNSWNDRPLVIRKATGSVDFLMKKYDAALAWTGYPAYDGTCLVYALAVPWDGQRALAERVRDKWVVEGFQHFRPLTEEAPYRH